MLTVQFPHPHGNFLMMNLRTKKVYTKIFTVWEDQASKLENASQQYRMIQFLKKSHLTYAFLTKICSDICELLKTEQVIYFKRNYEISYPVTCLTPLNKGST